MIVRFCLIFILKHYFCIAFNFDTQFPIIYNDPHNRMGIFSNKSSYFGYSIIMYGGKNKQQPWIQVGSPRSEDPSLPVSTPGAVFRCKIFKDCSLITVDRDIAVSNYYGHVYTDVKRDAWIGGTMDILPNNDVLIVCGFRWSGLISRNLQPFMMGSCYWDHLSENDHYRKILPLFDIDKFYITIKRHTWYNFALGQSGFSAHLTTDKHGPTALLGAPGVLNWEGTSLLISNLTTIYPSANVPSGNTYGSVLRGYAVTSGYYFKKGELLYVSSMPVGGSFKGMIEVFSFSESANRAVDVRDKKLGTQLGEYFGGSLASGDINADGYTDLLVGAPYHKVKQYNEGKVYVFFGDEKSLRPQGNLVGSSPGGLFGKTIAYIGDFDLDGYGDFAISAPYEDNTGVVYIYRGSPNGLNGQPSQVIRGKSIDPKIRGFGISFSKAADIDRNGYEDLAVGAYLSGTAVILRARPVLKLKQSLTVWGNKFTVTTTEMEVCLWFEGSFLPPFVNVNRTIILDKNYGRLLFENPQDAVQQETLQNERKTCRNYTINSKESVSNFEELVNIQVIQTMIEENRTSEPYIVGTTKKDKFCKTCPVMGPYTPLNTYIPFTLGCGEDNICKSHLSFDTIFSDVINSTSYIIGSTEHITMTTEVSNSGEKAYSTILIFELPEDVFFAFTPKLCAEGNSSQILICLVGNTIHTDERKQMQLRLNVGGIVYGTKKEEITFKVTVKTSSENLNRVQSKNYIVKLVSEADVLLTGKSNQLSYSYGNIVNGNSTFSQIYQITKFGKSPIDEVVLHMHIPISIRTSTQEINFLKLYPTVGDLAGQPITCKNITYVEYVDQFNIDDDLSSTIDQPLIPPPPRILLKRSTKFEQLNIVYTNNLNETRDDKNENYTNADYESNEYYNNSIPNTYMIDCSNAGVRCTTIRCVAGPFRSEHHVGVIHMKAYLDVSVLKDLLGIRTQIAFFTSANVSTEGFQQSGNKPDHTTVMTIFVGELLSTPVALWIVFLTIVVGFLLLLILTLCLYKAGFFKREDKLKLQALKKQEVEEEFLSAEAKEDVKEENENQPNGIENRASAEFEEIH